jgi:hypothetical protein
MDFDISHVSKIVQQYRRLLPRRSHTIKEIKMDKSFGYFVFGGLLLGALFGWLWAASTNPLTGMGIGAVVGMAIGWFAGAAAIEQKKKQK